MMDAGEPCGSPCVLSMGTDYRMQSEMDNGKITIKGVDSYFTSESAKQEVKSLLQKGGFVDMKNTLTAFAALHKDGFVVAWGVPQFGGDWLNVKIKGLEHKGLQPRFKGPVVKTKKRQKIIHLVGPRLGFTAITKELCTLDWGCDDYDKPAREKRLKLVGEWIKRNIDK
eukprot:UN24116